MIRLIAYTWFGMVLGVSFLATPIKFTAASLTMPVALDVGRATFHAFGKAEWLLSLALLVAAVRVGRGDSLETLDYLLIAAVLVIVFAQQAWMIPRLDLRVAAIINGETLSPSHLHKLYAGSEFCKAILLLLVGLWTGDRI